MYWKFQTIVLIAFELRFCFPASVADDISDGSTEVGVEGNWSVSDTAVSLLYHSFILFFMRLSQIDVFWYPVQ